MTAINQDEHWCMTKQPCLVSIFPLSLSPIDDWNPDSAVPNLLAVLQTACNLKETRCKIMWQYSHLPFLNLWASIFNSRGSVEYISSIISWILFTLFIFF